MKSFLIATAIVAVTPICALAADMSAPYTKAPLRGVVADPWNGFYAGVNIGAGLTSGPVTNNTLDATPGAGPIAFSTANIAAAGVIGGGQVGYNFRLSPNWLAGLEADFQGSSQKVTSLITQANGDFQSVTAKPDYFGTVRGRLGYITPGSTLLYATGGLAYGDVKTSIAHNLSNYSGGVTVNSGFVSQVKTGWTAGAGFETPLASNWTVKAEYLYTSLGSLSGAIPIINGVPFGTQTATVSMRNNILRGGVNYHF
ncbi:MAG: porin family protein [Rhizobiales bacterium]|nr:porin family protein [Hyphomicrobiales bacterium]